MLKNMSIRKVAEQPGKSVIYALKTDSINAPIEVLLMSTPETRLLLNSPEICGSEFQTIFSNGLCSALSALLESPTQIGKLLNANPIDILYILRGGLNFNLHEVIHKQLQCSSEVSFISSQRIPKDKGFDIAESAYEKWSLQDRSILCFGDISATGTTVTQAAQRTVKQYKLENKGPKRFLFITIGTIKALETTIELAKQLANDLGDSFDGLTVLFVEQFFYLYEFDELLKSNHLQHTDFFRRDFPATIEFEMDSVNNPICFLERCAIYDGGSRAFEPKTYTNNLIRYWESLKNSPFNIQELLKMKSNFLDYALPYEEWVEKRSWWDNASNDQLQALYETGNKVANSLINDSFDAIIEKRLTNLYARRK